PQSSANGVSQAATSTALNRSHTIAAAWSRSEISAGSSPNSHHLRWAITHARPRNRQPQPATRSRSALLTLIIMPGRLAPKPRDGHPDLGEQAAQQGQRDADHVAVVAVDAVHEPAAEAVEGEGPGDPQRLPARHVGGDLLVVRGAEPHEGGGDVGGAAAGRDVDDAVPGEQPPGPPPHHPPPGDRLLR